MTLIVAVNAALAGMTLAAPVTQKIEATAKSDSLRAINAAPANSRHVIHISVDGLGARWYQPLLASGVLPTFQRLQREGSWTFNARTDVDYTITLPNHTGMLTGRPVNNQFGHSDSGHHWITNITPLSDTTLHNNAGYYISSAFDTAHDHGLSTGLYASKDKFVLYEQSYGPQTGAPDVTGADNGRDKIDVFVNRDLDSTTMMTSLIADLRDTPAQYMFVHFADADLAGHRYSWGSVEYQQAVRSVDAKLGEILSAIGDSPVLNGQTWIVLSADHGGTGLGHGDIVDPLNYRIPMLIWGPNIPANKDLYALAQPAARFPDLSQPVFALGDQQPIRNSDGGNCAMAILGLPEITGSRVRTLYDFCGAPHARGEAWRYSDDADAPDARWASPGFDDSAWPAGPAPLGFGDPVSTTLAEGAACDQTPAMYFRSTVSVTDTAGVVSATLSLRRDDGAVVYVNGVEAARNNLPDGPLTHNTLALTAIANDDELAFGDVPLPGSMFAEGRNVIAVAVHQANLCSTDLMFDATLRLHRAAATPAPPTVSPTVTVTPIAHTATPSPGATATRTPVATRWALRLPAVLRP
jgi:hypothetical protein